MYLYPQIDRGHALLLAEKYAVKPVAKVAQMADQVGTQEATLRYTAVGAQRVFGARLQLLRDEFRNLAAPLGYPDQLSPKNQRIFDFEAAKFLHKEMQIVPGEAARDGSWQYVACILLPDIVCWRFGKAARPDYRVEPPVDNRERFLGGIRNALGRLWWRAFVLRDEEDDDPFHLLDPAKSGLTEDNFVQVLERPRIGGYASACRQILHEFIGQRRQAKGLSAKNPRQTLLREAMKRIVRRSSFVRLAALDAGATSELVREVFTETIEALSSPAHV